MTRSSTWIHLAAALGSLAANASSQTQYRGPRDEVVAPSRIRGAASPGANNEHHPPSSRSVFDIEGYARWEFWWEHNRDTYLWNRSDQSVNVEQDDGDRDLGFLFGPQARGQLRSVSGPTDVDIEKKIIPALLKSLSIDDVSVKRSALLALGKSGHLDAESHVAPYLAYRNPDVQKAAVLALGMLPTSSAFYRLARVFVDESASEEIRCWAAVALGLQGDPRSALLLADRLRRHLPAYVTAHSFEALTESTIFGLGLSKKRSSAPFLVSILQQLKRQPTPSGRLEASLLAALGRLGDSGSLPYLVKGLLDDRIPVRRAATLALTGFDGEAPSTLLETLLRSDPDQQTRSFAAIALARTSSDRARNALLTKLKSGDATSTRAFAAVALGILGDVSAVDELVPFLQRAHPRSLRAAVAIGLGLLRDSRSVDRLREVVVDKSEHPDLRGYAALSLGLLRDRASLPLLESRLSDEDEPIELRRSTVLSISLLGDSRVVPTLIAVIQRSNSDILIGMCVQGLGLLRSDASVDPLRNVLTGQLHSSARSMSGAAAALGYISDASHLPDLSRIAIGFNYRDRNSIVEDILMLL